MGISAVVITLNEEKRLGDCLDSVLWADEIVVVDGGSEDRTIDIARQYGANVFQRKFDNFSSQKNFALKSASKEWILFLDADERVSEALREEIKRVIRTQGYQGYNIPRKNIIFGKELKYGGHQSEKHLRLFKKGVSWFVNPIHEKVEIDGKVADLGSPIIHCSTVNMKEYIEKLDLYTDLEAEYLMKGEQKVAKFDLVLKPVAKFLKQYFLQKGYLDGREGFVFYLLSSFYVFVKYAKYWEMVKKRCEQ